jgi:hypothetical protein
VKPYVPCSTWHCATALQDEQRHVYIDDGLTADCANETDSALNGFCEVNCVVANVFDFCGGIMSMCLISVFFSR